MTQNEIIEMAKQAGLLPCQGIHMGDLKAFAKLVAESWGYGYDAGVKAEREACASMSDWILKEGGGTWGDAIRARGDKA